MENDERVMEKLVEALLQDVAQGLRAASVDNQRVITITHVVLEALRNGTTPELGNQMVAVAADYFARLLPVVEKHLKQE